MAFLAIVLASLQERFSLELPGPVWRAIPAYDDRWVFEWRDAESKTHGFTVVKPDDATDFQIHAEEKTDWWTSLAGVGRNCFYLHSYRNPDIPEPTDLLAFDLVTSSLRWVLPGGRFAAYYGGGSLVIAKKVGMALPFFDCDELTGDLVERDQVNSIAKTETWSEAVRYQREEPYYDLLEKFILKSTGLPVVGTIEYLDYADRMVFSFYLYENDSLVQYLLVSNRLREVEYLKVIERNLKKEGRGGLLLRDGCLYFVRNRKFFVGINLLFE